MNKNRLLLLALFLMPFFYQAQIKIANQKIYIEESVLRLVTYEKTSEGYKNVLSIVKHDTAITDSIDTFFVETLEPVAFHNELESAIEGLLKNSSLKTDLGYGSAMTSAYAKVTLGATVKDQRSIAGRLILKEKILGYDKSIFLESHDTMDTSRVARDQNTFLRYILRNIDVGNCIPKCRNNVEKVRYYLGKKKFPEYAKARMLALESYEDEKNSLLKLQLEKEKGDLVLKELIERQKVQKANLQDLQQKINRIDKEWEGFVPVDTSLLVARLALLGDSIGIIESQLSTMDLNYVLQDSDTVIDYDSLNVFFLIEEYRVEKMEIEIEQERNLGYQGEMMLKRLYQKSWESTYEVVNAISKKIDKRRGILGLASEGIENTTSRLNNSFFYIDVDSVQIEFNEGMIERIVACTRKVPVAGDDSKVERMVFTNVYPIGFSTFRNYKQTIQTQMLVESTSNYMIPLSELISYTPNARLNTRDFSPLDTVMTFLPQDHEFILHKPARSEIIKTKVYTDLVGLSDAEPNGLIQTEIEKRINLYTWRRPVSGGSFLNTSFMQFATPIFTLSKVDSKLRRLQVADFYAPDRASNTPMKYATTLDVFQHENLSAGMDLNLWLLDSQPWKTTFFFNTGFRFGRIAFSDSLKLSDTLSVKLPDFGANTFRWFPEFKFSAYPDEDFGFSVAYRPSIYFLMDEDVMQVPSKHSIESFGLQALNRSKWIHTFELGATIPFSERGEIYGRYRFNMLANNWKTNFHQAQFGVALSLTKALTSN